MNSLKRKIEESELEEQQLLENHPILPSSSTLFDDPNIPEGAIYEKIKGDCQTFTNFTEPQLLDIWRDVDPKINMRRGRGPRPKINNLDSLIVFLVHLKTNMEVQELAAHLGVKENPARVAIDRVREPLLMALEERWGQKPRPVPLTGSFPDIALLVDSTTIPVFRPKGNFDEAKSLYDMKNGVYGFKKEVAVQAAEPHYALFVQGKADGSVHDYKIFKDNHHSYEKYLTKTAAESKETGPANWAILGDNAYQGPDSDTPGVRRIFIPKTREVRNMVSHEELKRIRVPVECFFGRMKHLWKMSSGVYRNSHYHLNSDVDICVFLTNEHMKGNPLKMDDQRSFLAHITRQREEREEKEAKKKKQQESWKERKKQRVEMIIENH